MTMMWNTELHLWLPRSRTSHPETSDRGLMNIAGSAPCPPPFALLPITFTITHWPGLANHSDKSTFLPVITSDLGRRSFFSRFDSGTGLKFTCAAAAANMSHQQYIDNPDCTMFNTICPKICLIPISAALCA